ncbi:L,D-transpeptidase scaffold domain-containing protein [Mucilaginibacter psychrotolerans]|uniref:L,D-transpeptidase n=1 Tax=Mucilaginibacter psychrotolerans TaxID=1524096 RepID=A0A4Y8S9T3_9SPHI|nr:L,D-transpeptidase family protein [Mucilaginibacter psychrotolerans]TFF35395.1 L,D-transpeptidase [Mucilaginibacter psychrotolerans]
MKKNPILSDQYKPASTANTLLLVCLFLVVLLFALITGTSARADTNVNSHAAGKSLLSFNSPLERGYGGLCGGGVCSPQCITYKHTPPPLSRGESHNPSRELFFKVLPTNNADLSTEIRQQLAAGKLALNFPASTASFYLQQNFKANWVAGSNNGKQAWAAMLMMDCVLQFGLTHEAYHPNELLYTTLHDILERPNTVPADRQARYDIMLTDAILTFINHLHYGKLNPQYPAAKIDLDKAGSFKAVALLKQAMQSTDLMEVVLSAQPKNAWYNQLQYQMHLLTGLYQEDCYETPEALIRKMAINMERLRWADVDTLNGIQVNIPSYVLNFYHASSIDTFRVIVGKPGNPTPSLQSRIKYFTTAPEPKVPAKIFANELLPKAIKDVNYLAANNYAIYNYEGELIHPNKEYLIKIKQRPGRYYARQSSGCDNALGAVVFRFTNVYNIYLQDTPEQKLFGKPERALSLGCVRVQFADKLAAALLQNDGSADKVAAMQKAINAYQTKTFYLKKAVPLAITYLTCQVKNGEVVTYKDIYNLDASLELALYGANKAVATTR